MKKIEVRDIEQLADDCVEYHLRIKDVNEALMRIDILPDKIGDFSQKKTHFIEVITYLVARGKLKEWLVELSEFPFIIEWQKKLEICSDSKDVEDQIIRKKLGKLVQPHTRSTEYTPWHTKFIGRDNEINQLCSLLYSEPNIALYGMGGIGKTALAAECASRWDDSKKFPSGILWTNLEREAPELAVDRWLKSLHIESNGKNLNSQMYSLANHLTKYPAMLILDNAQNSNQVRKLMITVPGVVYLITTRDRSNVPPKVKLFHLNKLSENDSLELLRDLAGKDRINNEIDINKKICHLCGYLALALTLVGAQLRDTLRWDTVKKYKCHFEKKRLKMLSKGDYREDNVTLTFEISYEQIKDIYTQELFSKLALLSSSFSIDSITAMEKCDSDQLEESLYELVDASLLCKSKDNRFYFHDLIHEFASKKLECLPSDVIDKCKENLVDYFLDYVLKYGKDFDKISVEIENLFLSLGWVQVDKDKDLSVLADAVIDLSSFLKDRGFWLQAIKFGKKAFQLLEEEFFEEKSGKIAISVLSWIYLYQDNFEEAKIWAEKGLLLYSQINNEYGKACAMRKMGMSLHGLGEENKAIDLLKEALKIFRSIECQKGIGDALTTLGYFEKKKDVVNLEVGKRYFKEALDIFKNIGDKKEISITLYHNARLLSKCDNIKEAATMHKESLAIDKKLKRRPGIAYNQNSLGKIEIAQGNIEGGEKRLREAREIFYGMGAESRAKKIDNYLNNLDQKTRNENIVELANSLYIFGIILTFYLTYLLYQLWK
ncbi:NB-ARC domain-containing protein [Candidatus Uabimicrobium sp. HlEnr_7]|uniref:tetratricopeptide repeat protein n=1 Tax=Candidatus Uabimicrobium helgolandensis TaxID=3095367 RepID=UPI003558E1DF